MLSADEPPLNDLSDEQIHKLLGDIAPKVKELKEGATLMIDKEGGTTARRGIGSVTGSRTRR